MPTYEYRCADCGKTFDIVQSFTDDALTTCPECGGHLKKVFGSVGISFKGSGFYVNDSGSSKHSSPSHSSNSSPDSTSSDSSSGSPDSSPSTSSSGEKSTGEKKSSAKVSASKD